MTIVMITPSVTVPPRAIIDWLAEHNIPAGDALGPVFVDADAKIIYWSACVYRSDAEPWTEPDNGVSCHPSLRARHLDRLGLSSAATTLSDTAEGRIAVLQQTPLRVDLPVELLTSGGAL